MNVQTVLNSPPLKYPVYNALSYDSNGSGYYTISTGQYGGTCSVNGPRPCKQRPSREGYGSGSIPICNGCFVANGNQCLLNLDQAGCPPVKNKDDCLILDKQQNISPNSKFMQNQGPKIWDPDYCTTIPYGVGSGCSIPLCDEQKRYIGPDGPPAGTASAKSQKQCIDLVKAACVITTNVTSVTNEATVNIAPTSTSGSGTGATFTLISGTIGLNPTIVITNAVRSPSSGKGYALGDTVTFSSSALEGTGFGPTHGDLVLTLGYPIAGWMGPPFGPECNKNTSKLTCMKAGWWHGGEHCIWDDKKSECLGQPVWNCIGMLMPPNGGINPDCMVDGTIYTRTKDGATTKWCDNLTPSPSSREG